MTQSKAPYELAVSMFGVAPGGFLSLLNSILVSANNDINQLAITLAATDAFKASYGDTLSAEAKVDKMMASYGLIKSDGGIGAAAYNFFLGSLKDAGTDIGILFNAANQFLLNTTDPAWQVPKALLQNKVAVATYFTNVLANDSTDFSVLSEPLIKITATTDTSSITALESLFNSTSVGSDELAQSEPAETIKLVSGLVSDAAGKSIVYTLSEGDVQPKATIENFSVGDKFDFYDDLLPLISFDEVIVGDGSITMLVVSDSSVVEVVLTGIPVEFDVAGQNVSSFNAFFGDGSLM